MKWHDIINSPTPTYPWVGPVYGVAESAAVATQFVINPSESSLTMSGTALGATIQEQLLGSLTTQLQGALFADLSVPNQVTLYAGGHVDPVAQPGPFIPGNAPAQFSDAGTLSGQPAYGAYRNLEFSQSTTSVLSIDSQGNLSGTGLSFNTSAGQLDYILQGLTTSLGMTGLSTTNQSSLQGTIQPYGNGYKLTIPLHFTISDAGVVQTFDGQIVAYSSLVPEPSASSLAVVAFLALSVL